MMTVDEVIEWIEEGFPCTKEMKTIVNDEEGLYKGLHCYVLSLYNKKGQFLGLKVGSTTRPVKTRAKEVIGEYDADIVVIEYAKNFDLVDDMFAFECLLHRWARIQKKGEQHRADYFLDSSPFWKEDRKELDKIAKKLN